MGNFTAGDAGFKTVAPYDCLLSEAARIGPTAARFVERSGAEETTVCRTAARR
jgi:hypothetical protein